MKIQLLPTDACRSNEPTLYTSKGIALRYPKELVYTANLSITQ